ncbi:hypothetical protein K9N50_00530 [bacterium]|nr:hypothetical protein [bacterium]
MELKQNNTKYNLHIPEVQMKTIRILQSRPVLEYSGSDYTLEGRTGNNTNQPKSLIDKIMDRYKDTWETLAKL